MYVNPKTGAQRLARNGDPRPIAVSRSLEQGTSRARAREKEVIEPRLRRWAKEKSLPPSHVQKWLALDEPGRTRLLELAETLKMRAGQWVAVLGLLDEIAIRENQTIAE